MLGSSNYGAQLAAHLGLPYAYAYFFSDGRGVEDALRLYRDNYRPSERHPCPLATVCIWALAADSDDEAWRLFRTREYWRVGVEQGVRNPLVSPEQAAAHRYTRADEALIETLRGKAFVGTADRVATRLSEEAARLGLDELVIVTWTFDPAARRRSYELLADAFSLARSDAGRSPA
jgi:luciferase family oxidoreductase group 1